MHADPPRVHVGTSGWNYADWRGRFYPAGLPPRRWLEQYARSFDTVDVNTTFYRLTQRRAVWVEQRSTWPSTRASTSSRGRSLD